MVQRPARDHDEWAAVFERDGDRGVDGSIAADDADRPGARGDLTKHPGSMSAGSSRRDDPRRGSAARSPRSDLHRGPIGRRG